MNEEIVASFSLKSNCVLASPEEARWNEIGMSLMARVRALTGSENINSGEWLPVDQYLMGKFVDMGDVIFDKADVKRLLVNLKYFLRRKRAHEGKVGIDIAFLVA